jgi:hypothetical protein
MTRDYALAKIISIFALILGVSACQKSDSTNSPEISKNNSPITTFTTSTGSVFSQAQWSEPDGSVESVWKDPSGTIWSSIVGAFKNNAIVPDQKTSARDTDIDQIHVMDSPATEACQKIGGSLPTLTDFRKLQSFFEVVDRGSYGVLFTDKGKKDFYTIFPDAQYRWFWSSTVNPSHPEYAYAFYGGTGSFGLDGDFFYGVLRDGDNSVLCVK